MRRTMGTAAAILVTAGAILCACSDNGEKSLGTDDPVDTTLSLEDFAASWDGYIEAYSFPSDSGRIRIVLDEQGQGTVQFGDGDTLPAPTDPDAGYPPADQKPSNDGLYERIAYPVYETQLENTRLRLQIDVLDGYRDWCELQTPIYDEKNDHYACVPQWGAMSHELDAPCYLFPDGDPDDPNAERILVDCAKFELCIGPCTCTESSCAIDDAAVIKIDGALSDGGNTFEGTIAFGSPYTIRLTRQ